MSASGASVWWVVDPRSPSASERRLLTTLATRFGDPAVNEQVDMVFQVRRCEHDRTAPQPGHPAGLEDRTVEGVCSCR